MKFIQNKIKELPSFIELLDNVSISLGIFKMSQFS